ncbi:MAG: hypothetical protein PVJ64_04075 [Gemmatimonadales bacterium]|jgi:hypothetical protein
MKKALWSLVPLALLLAGCGSPEQDTTELASASPLASSGSTASFTPEEVGEYLVTVGGCHDCHTPGFSEVGWEVPESQYCLGGDFGWTGPWGTTYAPNLRLSVQNLTEDAWVEMLRTRTALPPMPWPNINRMHEDDMRAIYRYLVSLGPAGDPAPAALQPGQESSTPYVVLAPPQGLPE